MAHSSLVVELVTSCSLWRFSFCAMYFLMTETDLCTSLHITNTYIYNHGPKQNTIIIHPPPPKKKKNWTKLCELENIIRRVTPCWKFSDFLFTFLPIIFPLQNIDNKSLKTFIHPMKIVKKKNFKMGRIFFIFPNHLVRQMKYKEIK